MLNKLISIVQWLFTRVAVIYIVVFFFSLSCMDLKTVLMRTKARRLNDAIPDFSAMINFSKNQYAVKSSDLNASKSYLELVHQYLPDDEIVMQLLGYVDFYTGQEPKAIVLFKRAALIHGQPLFWSNYNLGVIYYKKGMWPEAAEYLLKAVSSSPKLTLILMQSSLVYKQIFANPSFHYSVVDELYDAQSHAYLLLLSSLLHLRQYDKMIILSNVCLTDQDLSYKDAFYYYDGIAFFEMGQIEKAYMFFQKSISIEKDNPDVYYYVANIFTHFGQKAQAQQLLQISYALHQKNDPRFPYDAHTQLRFF